MKTVITHFYNEEYLLPFWLKHHKKYFDHGVLIDYHSTDRSVEICREICPNWEIITSDTKEFSAVANDDQVDRIEKRSTSDGGWRIVLNTTEFLIGDFAHLDAPNFLEPGATITKGHETITNSPKVVKTDFIIPSCAMVDAPSLEGVYPDPSIPLIEQRSFGVPHPEAGAVDQMSWRKGRRLSNYFENYPRGRHYLENISDEKFMILWYGYSPMTDSLWKRIKQIKDKIPEIDKAFGMGIQHFMWDDKQLEARFKLFQSRASDLTETINHYSHWLAPWNSDDRA